MISLFVELILPIFIVIPGVIGFTLSLPLWLFYPLLVRFPPHLRVRRAIAMFFGLISLFLVLGLYTWLMISMEYALSIPSSQDWEIKQKYEDQAILEAWHHTIIPPPFQKSCYSNEEVVCQIAEGFSLGIWDWQINFDDIYWLSALISGTISAMTLQSMLRSFTRSEDVASVISTP